jgi:hypothetical protein
VKEGRGVAEELVETEADMQRCESKSNGSCAREATWKQSVHAGKGEVGRFLYFSYWCDEHAGRIAEHRKRGWLPPAKMTQIVPETA